MCWRRCHIFQAFINVIKIIVLIITLGCNNNIIRCLLCISKQLSKGTLLTTKFQYLGDTLQRQRDVKRKERHNQNVFDLKFNSLFLILFSFLFANIRIFISLILLRIFLSSFPFAQFISLV